MVDRARGAGRTIGFVPTMGFLHEGHMTLCDVARQHADFLVLSVFVNPLQFGAGEDLDRYPRDIEHDTRLAEDRGVDVMFVPEPHEVYPDGDVAFRIVAPSLDDVLCGRFRPGHFEGVLTVVAKLFHMVRPDVAVFGQKDLQQALLVRRMVKDLDFGIDIVVAPIVREPDGLAMSSRNVYLKDGQREAATALYRALDAARRQFAAGETRTTVLVDTARAILEDASGVVPQYVELVDAQTLRTPETASNGNALAVAAFVGNTRLIDNIILHGGFE